MSSAFPSMKCGPRSTSPTARSNPQDQVATHASGLPRESRARSSVAGADGREPVGAVLNQCPRSVQLAHRAARACGSDARVVAGRDVVAQRRPPPIASPVRTRDHQAAEPKTTSVRRPTSSAVAVEATRSATSPPRNRAISDRSHRLGARSATRESTRAGTQSGTQSAGPYRTRTVTSRSQAAATDGCEHPASRPGCYGSEGRGFESLRARFASVLVSGPHTDPVPYPTLRWSGFVGLSARSGALPRD